MKKTIEQGVKILTSVPQDEAEEAIRFLLKQIISETKIGLGLIDVEGVDKTPIFDMIDDIYREASRLRNCYFCSGTDIDPNEQEFNCDTNICPSCMLKLANYTKALGVSPELIFPTIGRKRDVQKSVMIFNDTPNSSVH